MFSVSVGRERGIQGRERGKCFPRVSSQFGKRKFCQPSTRVIHVVVAYKINAVDVSLLKPAKVDTVPN